MPIHHHDLIVIIDPPLSDHWIWPTSGLQSMHSDFLALTVTLAWDEQADRVWIMGQAVRPGHVEVTLAIFTLRVKLRYTNCDIRVVTLAIAHYVGLRDRL